VPINADRSIVYMILSVSSMGLLALNVLSEVSGPHFFFITLMQCFIRLSLPFEQMKQISMNSLFHVILIRVLLVFGRYHYLR
jgi:hypothetical protein